MIINLLITFYSLNGISHLNENTFDQTFIICYITNIQYSFLLLLQNYYLTFDLTHDNINIE